MTSRDDIIRKVKRCLALGESSNPTEAETAMRQAAAMMRRHQLTEADVHASDVGATTASAGAKRVPGWHRMLAAMVADLFGCVMIRRDFAGKHTEFQYVGVAPAHELAAYAYSALLRQCRQARRAYMRAGATPRQADSFCNVWVRGVHSKAKAFAGANTTATEANALVVVQQRTSAAIQAWIDAECGKIRSACIKTGSITADGARGWYAGREAELHQAMRGDASNTLAIE